MPLSAKANLTEENWRLYVASFVPSFGGNPHEPKTLQQLREIYAKLQDELENEDLSEQGQENLHGWSYICAVAILTWGQIDIIPDIYDHHSMLSHDGHTAGQIRITTMAFNSIVRYLLDRESQNTNQSHLEWYLQNKDKLEWNETLQRVVLKKSDTTQNSET